MSQFRSEQTTPRFWMVATLVSMSLAIAGWIRDVDGPDQRRSTRRNGHDVKRSGHRSTYADQFEMIEDLARSRHDPDAEDTLLELLRDAESDRVRLAAIRQLGRVGGERAIFELRDLILRGKPTLRDSAVYALGEIGGPDATDALIGLLRQGPMSQRLSVISALGSAGGPEAMQALIPFTRSRERHLQDAAIYALGLTRDPDAYRTLADLLENAHGSSAAMAAAQALGSLGTQEAEETLINLAMGGRLAMRTTAVGLLGQFHSENAGQALIHLAEDQNVQVSEYALHSLGELGDLPAARKALLNALNSDRTNVRLAAINALGMEGDPETIPHLIPLLKDPHLAGAAAYALANTQDPKARAALRQAAQDTPNREIQFIAMSALSDEYGTEAESILADLVSRGQADVAGHALWELAQRQGEEAMPLLQEAYQNGSMQLRHAALNAAAQLGGPEVKAFLFDAVQNGSTDAASTALHGLAEFDDPEARELLLTTLRTGPNSLKGPAAHALAQLGGDDVDEALFQALKGEHDPGISWYLAQNMTDGRRQQLVSMLNDPALSTDVKGRVIDTLSNSNDLSHLARAADHADPEIAAAALQGLYGQAQGDAVERAAINALARSDENVRQTAVGLLGQLNTPGALRALSSAMDDASCFDTAVSALTQVGGREAMGVLRDHFTAGTTEQRQTIIGHLNYVDDPHARTLLLQALDDDHLEVVGPAVRGLVSWQGDDVSDRLYHLIASDTDPELRRLAAGEVKEAGHTLYHTHRTLIDEILAEAG